MSDPKRPDDPDGAEAGSPEFEASTSGVGDPGSPEQRWIGNYLLLEVLGEGGMGTVWLAEQREPLRRRVALKLIKLGMDSREVIARFESERQALALLDHPGIAKVLDAGTTDRGNPFFAMEHVRGVPITEYCDRQTLTTRQRLELFIAACEAVQHAHQKGIIHRDIKPSNILVEDVDGRPAPKIIDFGVAKAISQRLTAKTLHTRRGVMIGTPAYMSPEQADMTALDVDTRTDIYSLGALLYELLVGVLPFEPKKLHEASLGEVQRIIREDEPPSLSTRLNSLGDRAVLVAVKRRTEPAKLTRRLHGDLEWVTAKALEKDRNRRYESATELAADVRRHLRHEAVLAGPPSRRYRARKFIRRHRVPSAIVTIVLVFGVLLTGTVFLQSRRVAAERDRAELAAVRAQAVSTFLQGVLAAADPIDGMGRHVSVLASMEAAVPRIAASFAGQPGLEGAIRHTIGQTFGRLGRFDEAEEQLRQALATRQQLLGADHPDIADTINALGEVRYDRGDLDDAERLYDEALAMRRRIFGPQGVEVAASIDNLGNVYQDRGDTDAAEKAYRDALAMRQVALGADHSDIASSMNNIATVLHDRLEMDEAEELYREALALSRRLLGENHPELATSLNNLAVLLQDRDRLEEAEPLYREALRIDREAFGTNHPDVVMQIDNLATLLEETGRYDEAEELFRESLVISEGLWGAGDVNVADSYSNLGGLVLERGDAAAALDYLERALAILDAQLPADHPAVVFAQADKGVALTRLGRYAEAETSLLAAYNAFLEDYGPDDEDVLDFAGWLADLYEAWGRPDAAAEFTAVAAGDAVAEPARAVRPPTR